MHPWMQRGGRAIAIARADAAAAGRRAAAAAASPSFAGAASH